MTLPQPVLNTAKADGKITIGFRPESLELSSEGTENAFPVDVDIVEELGSDAFVYGEVSGGGDGMRSDNIIARIDPHDAPRKGDRVWLKPQPHQRHFFSGSTGQRINEETGELTPVAG
jgi:multiple sugar transport system ATP-binding protein